MIKISSGINLLFPTPIWTFVINRSEEINSKMYNYIKSLQKKDHDGISKSNQLGWHSHNFDLNNLDVQSFINLISPNIKNVINDMNWDTEKNDVKIINMWSVVNIKGSFNARHIHPNSYLSAAYYIKAPQNCGDITFYDPRSAKTIRSPIRKSSNSVNHDNVNIIPKESLLVMFPSYLHHAVKENQSEEERMVISFNVDLKDKNY